MSARVRLVIDQGATYSQRLVYKTGEPATPADLTGYTARMQVRETVDAEAVLLELTTENGRIAIEPLAGAITLQLSATETAALAWRSGVYDLELVSAGGVVRRLAHGNVAVRPEVTRGA
jgi:hypothetical protein